VKTSELRSFSFPGGIYAEILFLSIFGFSKNSIFFSFFLFFSFLFFFLLFFSAAHAGSGAESEWPLS